MPSLTPRESECLNWIAAGKTAPEIGIILGISTHTVQEYVEKLREKFDAITQAQVVAKAYQEILSVVLASVVKPS